MKFAIQLLAAFIVGLAALALLVPAAHADSCAVSVHRRVAAVEVVNATYTPSYNAVPIAVVQVPAYSASYQPTTTLSPEATLLLQQMTALLQSHETRLSQVEHGQQPPALPVQPSALPVQPSAAPRRPDAPPPVPPMPPAAPEAAEQVGTPRLYASACARCHDQSNSSAKGGGFTLLAGGQELPLSCSQMIECVDRLTMSADDPKHMPRGVDPSPEEVNEVIAHLKTLAKQRK